MREKLLRFMTGRYGMDELSRTLCIAAMVCVLLSSFFRGLVVFTMIYYVGCILLVGAMLRILSRNVAKRQAENREFLVLCADARRFTATKRQQWEQRKSYRFFKCPDCKQRVRVPRGHGKICITCPKCKREFVKKS